jgi:hypothetical protein
LLTAFGERALILSTMFRDSARFFAVFREGANMARRVQAEPVRHEPNL